MTINDIIKYYNISYEKGDFYWFNEKWQDKRPHDLELSPVVLETFTSTQNPYNLHIDNRRLRVLDYTGWCYFPYYKSERGGVYRYFHNSINNGIVVITYDEDEKDDPAVIIYKDERITL